MPNKELRHRLIASVITPSRAELAMHCTPMAVRTVLIKAGGVDYLRGLAAKKALTIILKAASALAAERKGQGRGYAIDRAAIEEWVGANCARH